MTLRRLGLSPDSVRELAYTPDSTWLVTALMEDSAIIWNTGQSLSVGVARTRGDALTRVAFTPDGKWALVAEENGVFAITRCTVCSVPPLRKRVPPNTRSR